MHNTSHIPGVHPPPAIYTVAPTTSDIEARRVQPSISQIDSLVWPGDYRNL